MGNNEQFVHCREVVHSSECPLSEVPQYNRILTFSCTKFHASVTLCPLLVSSPKSGIVSFRPSHTKSNTCALNRVVGIYTSGKIISMK